MQREQTEHERGEMQQLLRKQQEQIKQLMQQLQQQTPQCSILDAGSTDSSAREVGRQTSFSKCVDRRLSEQPKPPPAPPPRPAWLAVEGCGGVGGEGLPDTPKAVRIHEETQEEEACWVGATGEGQDVWSGQTSSMMIPIQHLKIGKKRGMIGKSAGWGLMREERIVWSETEGQASASKRPRAAVPDGGGKTSLAGKHTVEAKGFSFRAPRFGRWWGSSHLSAELERDALSNTGTSEDCATISSILG